VIGSHELIYVDGGTLHIREQQTDYEVREGESLILFPGRHHAGTAPYDEGLRFYWIHFDVTARSPEEQGEHLRVAQHCKVGRPDRLTQLFRWFLDEQETGRLDRAVASLLVALMLAEVVESAPALPRVSGHEEVLGDRIRRYIKTHFHEPLSTRAIAGALGFNADYLGRCYRRRYGATITDSIHECRLRYAARLLLDSASNIDEIARRCGYANASYYRRLFKRRFGVSPRLYRSLYGKAHVNTE
jgi:AraC-like DNA-binding protein